MMSVLENVLITTWIAHYTNMKNKLWFIVMASIILLIPIFLWRSSSVIVSGMLLFMMMVIKERKFSNTFLILSFLAPCIPLLTSTLSHLLFSLVFDITIEYAKTSIYCDWLSLILMGVVGFGFIHLKNQLISVNQLDDWWALTLIFVDMISILYILLEMIIYNKLDIQIMYLLVMLVIILVALFVTLLFLILKRNQEILELEKTKLEVQNIQTVRTMYDTVLSTKHYIYYTLKKIQALTHSYKNPELHQLLEESLNKSARLRNVIYTGNPYFDYSFNEMLSTKSMMTDHLKVMILVKEETILNNKEYVDLLLRLFFTIYQASQKRQPFELILSMKQGNLFFSMQGHIQEEIVFDEELLKKIKQFQTNYTLTTKDDTFNFKAITLL